LISNFYKTQFCTQKKKVELKKKNKWVADPPHWVASHPKACTRGGHTTARGPHHGLLGVVRPPPITIVVDIKKKKKIEKSNGWLATHSMH
jgi:hypothetical protein